MRRVGDELPLRAIRVLEPGEHRVEAGREAAELVPAGHDDAFGEVAGLRDSLRRFRQSTHRSERGA